MQESIQRRDIEEVQENSNPSIQVERKPDIEGGAELQSALDSTASDFDVSGFKCSHEDCGLVHGHDTTKHRASDSSDMDAEEAASMEFNPNCHCGYSEAAREGMDWAPTPSKANSKAPIRDHTDRKMSELF